MVLVNWVFNLVWCILRNGSDSLVLSVVIGCFNMFDSEVVLVLMLLVRFSVG